MVDIDIVYQGELRCQAVHRPSQVAVTTDAPLDNQGRGESFSPTDLVAAALGVCMLTIMGIRSRKHGWNIDGSRVTVHKGMTVSGPRRIERLVVLLEVANGASLGAEARAVLEDAAHTCPVRLSIHPDIDVPTTFIWT